MTARLLVLVATVVLALVAAMPAVAGEPFWTQRPDVSLQGNVLVASNGGWASYSGPVTKYVFRFVRDGVGVKGTDPLPKSTPGNAPLPAGTYPDDLSANVYAPGPADFGHCFVVEVWGGTRSTYYTTDGALAYDAWEWGHLDSWGNPAVTNQLCIGELVSSPPVIAPQVLRGGRANQPYGQQLSVYGGIAPYSFAVVGGALPKGMRLSPDGLLVGTPDAPAGEYAFTVAASDKYGVTATLQLVFTVLPPRIRFVTETLPDGVRLRPYRAALEVSGGSEPYAMSVIAGRLPRGLVLAPGGTLRGRPARAGTFAFTVRATDANGVTRRHYYSLRVGLAQAPKRATVAARSRRGRKEIARRLQTQAASLKNDDILSR